MTECLYLGDALGGMAWRICQALAWNHPFGNTETPCSPATHLQVACLPGT